MRWLGEILCGFPCATGAVTGWLLTAFAVGITHAGERVSSTSALDAHAPKFEIATWKTEQGLPQNRVECLLQTRDGYLWVGTGSGLARFDGVRFTTYNRANTGAFRSEACKALAEDSEGNLWVGTKGGLLMRRPGRFIPFTTAEGLCHDEVSALTVCQESGVWIGTGGGVSLFIKGRFTNYINHSLKHKHVYSLCEDRDGALWVGFATGLFKLDRLTGTFRQIWRTPGESPRENYDIVTCVYQDRQKRVWIGTYHGVYQFVGEQPTRYRIGNREENGEIRSIFEDANGTVWVLSGNALSRFDSDRFVAVTLPDILQDDSLRSVCKDREGNLWLGAASKGLNRLRHPVLTVYSTRNGLVHNDVWSVAEGKHAVWIGTSGGINQFKNGQLSVWTNLWEFNRQGGSVRSLLEDRYGGMWIGTAFSGAWHLQEANQAWYQVDSWAGVFQTRAIFQDSATNIWVGNRGSLCLGRPVPVWCEDRDHWSLNTHGELWSYRANEVVRVLGNEHWCYRGGAWEHHPRSVVYHNEEHVCTGSVLTPDRLQQESWTTNRLQGALSHYDVRGILEDRQHNLWFATAGGGLNRLQQGRFMAFTTRDGLISNETSALHEDSEGALWIGTEHGLSRFKEGRFSNFSIDNGLFDNLINQILEDDFGYLWISCRRGIFRASRRVLNEVADAKASSVNCISFGEADGMLASETNGQMQPAGCKSRDGKLWFPTVRGVVVIDPSIVKDNASVPNVIIEEVRMNDSAIFNDGRVFLTSPSSRKRAAEWEVIEAHHELPSPIHLPPGSGNLVEIRYTATSLGAPAKVRFKYRLQGQQNDWRTADERRVAYFTNLRPGQYHFDVIACNDHGVWNEKGASLAFVIAPHYYETLWFRSGSVGVLVAMAYTVYRRRLKNLRRLERLERQDAVASERERIRRDIHDELGAQVGNISLVADLALKNSGSDPNSMTSLQRISRFSREMSASLDEIVWALDQQNDTLPRLLARIREYVSEFARASQLDAKFDWPGEIPEYSVSAELRHNLLLVIKQALRNVAEHAAADVLWAHVGISDGQLTLTLQDDGCGFDYASVSAHSSGNGLTNMQKRLAALGAEFQLDSQPGKGTRILICLPLRT
ncbi:MAG: hypothetical protein HY735_14495 [Verrucomicrobia bacterium]|nr:hypothetical protein [Verrucomicrobiota bacterium]